MAKADKQPRGPERASTGVSYSGEEPRDTLDQPVPPLVERSEQNRGVPAQETEGAAVGSGAGAGGGGGPEDYDDDPQGGGGRFPTHNPKGGQGGDAPKHNSR
jgi:hypothetical protein